VSACSQLCQTEPWPPRPVPAVDMNLGRSNAERLSGTVFITFESRFQLNQVQGIPAGRKCAEIWGNAIRARFDLSQQVIVDRDRPELLAIAEAYLALARKAGWNSSNSCSMAGRSSG
jgi:hypothetical protein